MGEQIGNPQLLFDMDDEGDTIESTQLRNTNKDYSSLSKVVPTKAMVGNGGHGQQAKSEIITYPIVSLTPYQNMYVIMIIN